MIVVIGTAVIQYIELPLNRLCGKRVNSCPNRKSHFRFNKKELS
jgi:hypothetical protein